MKTPLFILLQATGGIRNEVNTFLSDYAVPVIAVLLIVGVGIGAVSYTHLKRRGSLRSRM